MHVLQRSIEPAEEERTLLVRVDKVSFVQEAEVPD